MSAFAINIKLTESPIVIVKNSSHQRRASDQEVASPGPVHAFQHSFAWSVFNPGPSGVYDGDNPECAGEG